MRSNVVVTVFLAAAVLLAACGGENKEAASNPSSAKFASLLVDSLNGSFSGVRSNYAITKTDTGVTVVDYVGSDGTTMLDSTVPALKFTDLTVSPGVGEKAASIASADLKTLIELYVAYFNRVPDAEGLAYWIEQFKAGQSLEQIGKSFYEAAIQFSTLTGYTATMTNADFIKVIYKNVLGRTTVDQAGLDYWTNSLASGGETRGTLVKTILGSAHTFKGDATYGYVADLLDNKNTVANYFAVQQGLSYNTATDSITKGMAIAAAVTSTSTTSATKMIGVADASFDLAPTCLSPAVLQNGGCIEPANKPPRPTVKFDIAVSPSGQTYTAILCYDSNQCDSLGSPVFVTTAEILASNGEIAASVAMASKVADEYNNMIGRLWVANTIPTNQTMISILRNAIATALANESASAAIAEAVAAFSAAGFPAAGSTSSNMASATGDTASVCNISNYLGPNTDPQFDTFCQNAFINTCLDKSTGTSTYQSSTISVCTVLDGFLKATGGESAVKYCSYCR